MTYRLPGGWKEVKLGEVVKYNNGKKPNIVYESGHKNLSNKYPLYGGNGMYAYTDCFNAANSIVIGRVGAYCGSVFKVNKKYWISDNAIQARVKDAEVTDINYLYFLYKSLGLNRLKQGTSQPLLNQNILKNIRVGLPPLEEQKAIADTLSALDDKIELNCKINENLEAQAQAIFKHWFIDFEFPDENGNPYKSSGGEMVESELGMIPKGWEIVKLKSLVSEIETGNWGKGKIEGNHTEEVYCIRGADIPELYKGNRGNMPTRFVIPKNKNIKRLKPGEIVIEMSGGSPTQSTGRLLYIDKYILDRFSKPMLCTNFCKVFRIKKGWSIYFYYFWVYLYNKNYMFSYENGTTGIKNLDEKSLLNNTYVPIPTIEDLKLFNTYIEKINKNKSMLGTQNQTLSQLRDTLLPKLMSGEIRIPLDE